MISFFARPSYLGNRFPQHFNESCHLRLSSEVRGRQIAEYLGAKYNPKSDYEEDTCIYIKPMTLDRIRDNNCVDVCDGTWVVNLLKKRPLIRAIAHSQYCSEYLKSQLGNTVVTIPTFHLNWENIRRERTTFTTGGYIGSPSPAALEMYQSIKDKLEAANFQFTTCFDYKTREDAVNFYKSIDFLVIGPWRENGPYKTPTKMINAASFGVPSIAYPLVGYQEWEGNYIRACDEQEIIEAACYLRDHFCDSDSIIKAAESYHISQIADRYRSL